MGNSINLAGQKFGKWTATNQTYRQNGRTLRLCNCDCGNQRWVLTHGLISGHTKSCGCSIKLPPGRASRNRLLLDYKMSAKRRDLSWSLIDTEFDHLVTGNCHFCRRPPSRMRRQRHCNGAFYFNGIDRLDNDRGYEIKNVVTCCKICNYAKGKMNMKEFTQWVKDLSEAYTHGW